MRRRKQIGLYQALGKFKMSFHAQEMHVSNVLACTADAIEHKLVGHLERCLSWHNHIHAIATAFFT